MPSPWDFFSSHFLISELLLIIQFLGLPWVKAGTLHLIQPCASTRMFAWIEKVVPHPPVKFHPPVVGEEDAPVEQRAAEEEPGLAKQLPEGDFCNPAEGPIRGEALGTTDPRLLRESAGQGLLSWLSQGLQKVVPQPPESSLVPLRVAAKNTEASIDIPEVTEVQSINEEEEELEVTVLEPEDQAEVQSSSGSSAPDSINGGKVFTWLMEGLEKIMPQPENRKEAEEVAPERPAEESADSKERNRGTSQSDPFPASPPSSTGAKGGASSDKQSYLSLPLFPQRPGDDRAHSLFKRFLQGLEKVMPQPVTKAKQDGQHMKNTVWGPEEETSKGA